MISRVLAVAAVALTAAAGSVAGKDNPLTESPTWDQLKAAVIGDVVPKEAGGVLAFVAPYRASDSSAVPIELAQVGDERIRRLTLIIDENPAPVAAIIELGEAMFPLRFETQVRVDQYSNVRAVAETDSGHFMSGAYVKASGGCSAPATSDAAEALKTMGDMTLQHFADPAPGRREAQVKIRHPNYSGLSRDQLTQLFVPPHFIEYVEVRQGDELLFKLEGGISISEDPVFLFDYTDNGAADIVVEVRDTEGNVFRQVLPKPGAS